MSITNPAFARRGSDGHAVIGRTRHDLRGIRFADGEDGNAPADASAEDAAAQQLLAQWAADTDDAGTNGDSANTPDTEPKEISQLPSWAQKIISDARKGEGDYRTAKKQAEDKLNAILQAAGIGKDDDPAEALKTRTSERDTATAERDAAVRELAIFKAAHAAGADPAKLLDRNSFMSSVKGLDVSDGSALTAAIKAAVKSDPTLKAVRAAGASTVESGGPGELGQITEEQLARMTPEQIVDAQQKGLLKNLL